MFELQVLGDWTSTGAIAAGNLYRPTALAGDAELDSSEVAEVLYLEVVPPVTGGGAIENLENIRLVLDGKEHPFININGTDTYLMQSPWTNIFKGGATKFGMPLIDAVKTDAPLLLATCPKYSNDLRVQAQAGTGGISADFRIRAWGYRYKLDQLSFLFGDSIGGSLSIADNRNQRNLELFKVPVVPSKDTWTQLPGGLDQAVPKINFLIRYAFNANATTPNIAYQMRYDTGDVGIQEENQRFEYDRIKNALLVQGLGTNAPANLSKTFLNIDGDDRPDSRFPTEQNNNPLHFGRGTPILPATLPMYFTVRKLDKPYLIWNEIGYVGVVDNGTSIAANQIATAIYGTIIEMGRG